MEASGLQAAFFRAVNAGLPPSQNAILAVPVALGALCLNSAGPELVRQSNVLNSLGSFFTTERYIKVMHGKLISFASWTEARADVLGTD